MYIKEISDSDKAIYDNLAEKYGNVFNTLKWLKLYKDKIKIYGFFDEDNRLIGGFHLYENKKYFLKYYNNPPFTPFIGPFFINKSSTYFKIQNFQKKVSKKIAQFTKKLNAIILFFSLDRTIIDVQPFIWEKFKVYIRYTYTINLRINNEKIWENFSPERRNDIRKANNDGVKIFKGSDKNTLMELIIKSLTRQNKAIDIKSLEKIVFKFSSEINSFYFIAYYKEKPISVSFCIHDKKKAFYVIGGYDSNNKHHGAGASTLWECIKHAKKLDLKEFDFDGSMIPNIERFFRGFGGKLVPFYRINRINYFINLALSLVNKSNL
ncbi:MAG: GNAT family N-acetyltransferase [Armatimonadetes bacterium]|nr:GNAT family N-acetyltransferase [Armatimonadota bacterium]